MGNIKLFIATITFLMGIAILKLAGAEAFVAYCVICVILIISWLDVEESIEGGIS